MKTKPKPPVKLPKARVMYACSYKHLHNIDTLTPIYNGKIPTLDQIPVAVLPCRTRQEAREIVRLFSCDAEEFTARNSQGHLLKHMRRTRP